MIPRHSFMFAALLLLPIFAVAQSNYKPGYIVTSQGDTVKGAVNYGDWPENPKSIDFKATAGTSTEKLTAQNVKFFSVSTGQLTEFETYAGPISTDNTDLNHLSIGKDTSVRLDTVFLRVLQDGSKIKLFSYTDGKKKRFFIASDFSAQPVELVYRIYLNNNDGTGQNTMYETGYKGQLYDAAVKGGAMTPVLKNIISNANYKDEDLATITAVINNISVKDLAKNNPHKVKASTIVLVSAGIAAVLVLLVTQFVQVNHH